MKPGPKLPSPRLQRTLDAISSRIQEPISKLWFLKTSLARFESSSAVLRRLPFTSDVLLAYIAMQSLAELCQSPRAAHVPLPRRRILWLHRLRYPLALAVFAVSLFLGFHVGQVGYDVAVVARTWLSDQLRPLVASTEDSIDLEPILALPDRVGAPPEDVWLVEEKQDEEFWSNGLRIDTRFTTKTHARSYVSFPLNDASASQRHGRPIGIVYHTTESDMAPLAADSSEDVLATTRDLIGWLSRRGIYHYVIDRFGQVFRTVPDDDVAVHAGQSIWADEENFYLDLNDSFLGVAFESRMDARSIITQAQLQSAINLTDLLRIRYGLDDQNCVPHGLVSVSAIRRSVGYHLDWVRGFPFGALGLSDKYSTPPPSITLFGLRPGTELLQRLGESWPGLAKAEAMLAATASENQVSIGAYRDRLQQKYLGFLELNKQLRNARPSQTAD